MSEVVLKPDPGLFPIGTVVKVYLRPLPEAGGTLEGAPPGSVLSEPAVAAAGTLTVTGLTIGKRYVGWAVVGGVDHYLRFQLPVEAAAGLTKAEAEAIAANSTATEKERAEAAEVLKAPLASPGLTGSPTVPTAAEGDSSTKVADTAFVTGVEAELEAEVALKAPLASPTFTGVPAAPTAAAGTSTTQLATTAFAAGLVAGGAGSVIYAAAPPAGFTAVKADGNVVFDAGMTINTKILKSATAGFTAADVGKVFGIAEAGAGSVALVGTIEEFISATEVKVSSEAKVAAANKELVWGTDSTTALQELVKLASKVAHEVGTATEVRLPGGMLLVQQLEMYKFVHVRGANQWGTVIRRVPGAAKLATIVIAAESKGTSEANIFWTLSDLTLDGGKAVDTLVGKGIYLDPGARPEARWGLYGIPAMQRVERVTVVNYAGAGIEVIANVHELFVEKCQVFRCNGYGINEEGSDCNFTDIVVGWCGNTAAFHNIHAAGSNNRWTHVRSWWAGRTISRAGVASVKNTEADAWFVDGSAGGIATTQCQFVGCLGQDSSGWGARFKEAKECRWEGQTSGCRLGGVKLDKAENCEIDTQMNFSTDHPTETPKAGVEFVNTPVKNKVIIQFGTHAETVTTQIVGTIGENNLVLGQPAKPVAGAENTVVVGQLGTVRQVVAAIKGNNVETKFKVKHGLNTQIAAVNILSATFEEPVTMLAKSVAISAEEIEVTFTIAPGAGAVNYVVITG